MTIQGNGFTVETSLSFAEAIAICRNLQNNFANDLHAKHVQGVNLSNNQRAWAYRLAEESQRKTATAGAPVAVAKPVQLSNLCGFIGAADERKDGVFLTFKTDFGTLEIKSASKKNPANAGVCWVTDGGPFGESKLYGKVQLQTKKFLGRNCPTWVEEILEQLNKDPQGFCAEYGLKTGQCCFCALPLTDETSVAWGYGPVCAKTWGMPHGKRALKKRNCSKVQSLYDNEDIQAELQAEAEAFKRSEQKAEAQAASEGFM